MNVDLINYCRYSLIVVALMLSGCISHQQYRVDYALCTSADPEAECQKSSMQQYSDRAQADQEYFIGFVEFDDQGQLWDRKQLNSLIDQLQKDTAEQDTLMVVFAHGWKHSADVKDKNIQSFRRTLKRLSALDSSIRKKYTDKGPRKVAGIYLGWRGGSLKIPWVENATFWDRKTTAHKVGSGGVTEVLSRLELIKKAKQESAQQSGVDSNTRLVIVGHSFGGAVIYSALSGVLENNFHQMPGAGDTDNYSGGFSNLVVLINPAFEAMRYSNLSDMATEQASYNAHQLPALAVLTSEADLATKIAFPAGRYFSTIFEKERKARRFNPISQQHESINQGSANVSAVGHFDPYSTHYLSATSKEDDDTRATLSLEAEVETFLTVTNSWENDHPGSKINFAGSILERSTNSAGRNPYLNIRVDQALINDHNDIEDPRVESFIRHLILISSQHRDLETRRQQRN